MAGRQELRQWSLDLLENLLLKHCKRDAVAEEDYDKAFMVKRQEGDARCRLEASRRIFLDHFGERSLVALIEDVQTRIRIEKDVDLIAELQDKLTHVAACVKGCEKMWISMEEELRDSLRAKHVLPWESTCTISSSNPAPQPLWSIGPLPLSPHGSLKRSRITCPNVSGSTDSDQSRANDCKRCSTVRPAEDSVSIPGGKLMSKSRSAKNTSVVGQSSTIVSKSSCSISTAAPPETSHQKDQTYHHSHLLSRLLCVAHNDSPKFATLWSEASNLMKRAVGHCCVDAFDDSRSDPEVKSALRLLPSDTCWMLGRVDAQSPYSVVGIGSNKTKRERATKLALALSYICRLENSHPSGPAAFLQLLDKVREQKRRPCKMLLDPAIIKDLPCFLQRSPHEEEPSIIGISFQSSAMCFAEAWDRMRAMIIDNFRAEDVKCEMPDEHSMTYLTPGVSEAREVVDRQERETEYLVDQAPQHGDMKEVSTADVRYTQRTCSMQFRNGQALAKLVEALQNGSANPLKDDFLVLDVVEAKVRMNIGHRKLLYFSLDHRRLICIKRAGCPRMRVCVKMRGNVVDEFVRKLGIDGTNIRISGKRSRVLQ